MDFFVLLSCAATFVILMLATAWLRRKTYREITKAVLRKHLRIVK